MNEQGYSFLEALIALGIAALLFTGALGVVFLSNTLSAEGLTREQALWRAQEGLEALKTMDFDDLYETDIGSLAYATEQWSLGQDGPELLTAGMSRIVRVEAVGRSESCEVEEGGDEDIDSYELISEVSWTDNRGNPQTVALSALRTNWEEPQGDCFTEGGGMCECLAFDTSQADLYWWNYRMRDVFVEHECCCYEGGDDGGYTEDDGEVTMNECVELTAEVIGSAISFGQGGPEVPVYVLVRVDHPDETYDEYELWGYQDVDGGETWTDLAEEGSTFTIRAEADLGSYSNIYWSTDPVQAICVLNGEQPPEFDPYEGQPSIEEFLEPYLDEETGTVVIQDNQVLCLWELGSSDPDSPAFDMQDLVMLTTLDSGEGCDEYPEPDCGCAAQAVMVDKATVTYDSGASIQEIDFEGITFWSKYGPGTPSGNQYSGTQLDGEDNAIYSGESEEISMIKFGSSMSGRTFNIQLECTDGSTVNSGDFTLY